MDERLLSEFLAEAEETVEELYGELAELRARRGEGAARRELVARIFRRVHTLKGSASAAGLGATSELAHEFEALLDAVRLGRAPVDEEMIEASLDAVGAIAASLVAASMGERGVAPGEVVERLRRHASAGGAAEASVPDSELPLPEDVALSLDAHERRRLLEALSDGARAYVVTAEFDLATFDEQFRLLSNTLAEVGEVVSTRPFADTDRPEHVGFRVVFACSAPHAEVSGLVARLGAWLSHGVEYKDALGIEGASGVEREDVSGVEGVLGVEGEDALVVGEAHTTGARARASSAEARATDVETRARIVSPPKLLRVPLEELDDLISEAHGLFSETAGALDLALDGSARSESRKGGMRSESKRSVGLSESKTDDVLFESGTGDARAGSREELAERASRVRRRFSELERRLIGLRMVSLRATIARAVRAGEAVARAAGKSVEFELAGTDVRLDRSLADALAGPLLHLVHNAVDHGIETSQERRDAGKPERGLIRVEASAEGGRVLLRVSDDGRGVDAESVARAGGRCGLVPSGAQITDEMALRLIFRPGFSTVPSATLVSGRGVGLDVVERAVEESGGEVRVRSERGRGTTFELRLPATLALLPSRIVRCAGRLYCLSEAQIADAGHTNDDDLKREGARTSLHWRGREIARVHLRELLGYNASFGDVEQDTPGVDIGPGAQTGRASRAAFVVARAGRGVGDELSDDDVDERCVAVFVDELGEQVEALVRGLGRHAARWRGVSGAAELRDGEVALVLDLPRLLESRA